MELTQQQKDQVIDVIAQRLLAYQNQQALLQTQTVPYTQAGLNTPLTLTAINTNPSLEYNPDWLYEAPDIPENKLPWDTDDNELEDSLFSSDSFSDSTMLSTEYDDTTPTEYLITNDDSSENELLYDVDNLEDFYLTDELTTDSSDLTTEEMPKIENNIETEKKAEVETETETKQETQSEDFPVETIAYEYIPFPTENGELINTNTDTLTDELSEITPQPQTPTTLAETPMTITSNESETLAETPATMASSESETLAEIPPSTPAPLIDSVSQNTLSNRIQNASENFVSQTPTSVPTFNPFVNAPIPDPTPSPMTTNNQKQDSTQNKTLELKQAEEEKAKQSNFLVRSGDWLQRNIFDRIGNWLPVGFLGKVIKMTGNVLTGLLKTVGHLFDGQWRKAGETGFSWIKDTAIIGSSVAGIYALGKQIKRWRKSNSDTNTVSTSTTPTTPTQKSNTSPSTTPIANTRTPLGEPVSLDNTLDTTALYQQSSQKSNG